MSFDSGKVESFGFPLRTPVPYMVQEVLYHRGHGVHRGNLVFLLWTFVALVVEGLCVLR